MINRNVSFVSYRIPMSRLVAASDTLRASSCSIRFTSVTRSMTCSCLFRRLDFHPSKFYQRDEANWFSIDFQSIDDNVDLENGTFDLPIANLRRRLSSFRESFWLLRLFWAAPAPSWLISLDQFWRIASDCKPLWVPFWSTWSEYIQTNRNPASESKINSIFWIDWFFEFE